MSEQAENQHEKHDGGQHLPGGTVRSAAEVWDELYRSKPRIWSGKPNPQLVREAGGLKPGKALDLGCGEGADAIWLAQHGWTVTAVDVSAVALERARAHEKAALDREGVHAHDGSTPSRITWQQADLGQWQPGSAFDLVTAQYLHADNRDWRGPLRMAASAVKPGGTLLIVGHHPDHLPPWRDGEAPRDRFYNGRELVRELALEDPGWQLEVATTRERPVAGPDGQEAVIGDVVVRATRLP
ncbi:class I SAM-dependent methyltransferase [Pseudarthrobacter sp. NPDC092419]|uniref:class I SAM-dependent methyltransferase n=1 Tax=Pseudarthrobacter sp. NPDC092419 TaxID=3364414 RepID=UPI0037F28753